MKHFHGIFILQTLEQLHIFDGYLSRSDESQRYSMNQQTECYL